MLWIGEQLTILAAKFEHQITAQKLMLDAEDVADIPREKLEVAFARARRELNWYPKTPELRQMAGALSPQDALEAGAMDAWLKVLRYVSREYTPDLPCRPNFDDRTWHSVRAVGGIGRVYSVSEAHLGFVKKEFLEAWKGAQNVEAFKQLTDSGNQKQLQEAIKGALEGKRLQ